MRKIPYNSAQNVVESQIADLRRKKLDLEIVSELESRAYHVTYETENIQRNSGRMITEKLPNSEIAEPYVPRRVAPTYTFWDQSGKAFPFGDIVYFIYCAGRIKIGYSTDINDRRSGLSTGAPYPPVAILVVSGGRNLEAEFHARFATDRRHGEWFAISQHLRNFLKRHLCPIGRDSFAKAEADFKEAMTPAESSEPYRAPKWQKPRKKCTHNKPWTPMCPKCVRERDLKILEGLNERNSNNG